ncbi:polymorphic toxin-type HINT domain-containing protein [Streptantibioticus parmotrematis]|uniref:polymorphic toxin-type HINT domain-containing protein n=1 Tax=Streptantibioticus parmotrematis TaxID=2873249 RepID=UPI0033C4E637
MTSRGSTHRPGLFGDPRRPGGATLLWRSAVALLVLALLSYLSQLTAPAEAATAHRRPPVAAKDKPVPVTPVTSHYQRPKTMPAYHSSPVTWPTGQAKVTLGQKAPASPDAVTQSGAARGARAGVLPVWLAAPASRGHAAVPSSASASAATTAVDVDVLPRDRATAVGADGVLLTLNRADAGRTGTNVGVTLDYSSFTSAFGGDWASRLRLVSLPSCALTTPTLASCRTETPVASTNDASTHTVTADVTLSGAAGGSAVTPATGSRASAAVLTGADQSTRVLAATSAPGGGGGDFTATSLTPSSSWQAGGSSDAFQWSYPISVPGVPGGLAPKIALGYDSQSQDGLTSSTNNQASWVGDGFDYNPGFIERSYQSCEQNPSGPTKTADNCWSDENTITLSLNGTSATLVKDDTTGTWHAEHDGDERVQYKTGAVNGAQNGEYWVVTTDDGTQYYFGLDQLPGYASGDTATNSVWTEPVYATASGQPCYNATFANSWCQQAYRWNLDYVVDPHQDAISYYYTTDTGYYARDNGTTANTAYTRDGYLDKIQYGQRAGQVYATSPAAQVTFKVNGRCDTSQSGCATSGLTSSSAAQWPDVPYDLNCTNGKACSVTSPTFWSENELTTIQTQALVGTTETDVDSWTLAHTFPATGDSTTPALWLSTITRTGQDTSGGGSTASLTMPPVTLTGTALSNRVDVTDGYPPITRHRLNGITTETGEIIDVAYSTAACGSGTPSDASQNTSLCYPAYWTPAGVTSPKEDWFNKYIVTGVTQQDPTGGGVNDTITTHYQPVGTPAWHYDDNPLTPTAQRTWNQWRGYQGMKVTTGTAPDPVTETDYTYFRGMDGDTLPGGATRSATITDSREDTAVTDSEQYAGTTYETIQYDGAGSGKVVTDTITDPWSSAATATHKLGAGLPDQVAYITGEAEQRVYTPLSSGSTRETEVSYTHDSHGRVTRTDDLGDAAVASDDLCTTVTYDDNTDAWILDTPDETDTVSVKCGATVSLPGDAVSDVRRFYDGSTTFGSPPTAGDVTSQQKATSYNGSTPVYTTTSSSQVDEYGRTLAATDADGRTTKTAYTPVTGAEPASETVTDPLTHTTTTTYDPLRELTTQTTDPAGYVTKEQYDALGRVTADFKPGITAAYDKYTYAVSNSAPSVVTTQTLDDDQSYRTSEVLYDAMLRQRETQSSTMDGGRLVSDTVYNTDGLAAKSTSPYYAGGAPSATLVQAQDGDVPSETGYLYDGAGRQTAAVSYALGTETWRTTTSYGGDVTTTVPPAGGTAQSVFTDARGNTSAQYQYHQGVPDDPSDPAADYSVTKYAYDAAGHRTGETDAAGNSWSWSYDLLGDDTSQADPDTGTTMSTYDNAGQLLTTTDARGKQTTYQYDADGRKTVAYDTTGGATPSASDQIDAWTYDTLKKGLPTSSTSYQKGTSSPSVASTVLAYNTFGTAVAQRETLANLPSSEAALEPSGGYVSSDTFTAGVGLVASQSYAAVGGLPAEQVYYGHDTYGDPTSAESNSSTVSADYVNALGYDEFGKPSQYTMGTSGDWVALDLGYDQQTQRLTDARTTDSAASTTVDDTQYTYGNGQVSSGSGLVTSTTDAQNGGAVTDTQCFQYDYATRLTAAWTATDKCTATPSAGSSSTVGGPQPYWQSWTYDAAGDRQTQTDHDTGGNTADDTTTTYAYPDQGSSGDQPHTLSNTTATGPGETAGTASYKYDASGDDTSITTDSGTQTLTWNDQGKLASLADTATGGTTGYLYDADGNLVLRTDAHQATLFLADDQQVTENLSNSALSGTRYYEIGGETVAERSSTGDVQYLIPDRQGTDTLAVDFPSMSVTRRAYLPFGQARGTAPSSWPGDDGYVGGTPDPDTGLENLGAREYDPNTGRFLSADPVFEASDPTQLGGYDYAGNDPVTGSDPDGTMLIGGDGYVGSEAWFQSNPQVTHSGPPKDPSSPSYQFDMEVYHNSATFGDPVYYHPAPKPSHPSFFDYLKDAARIGYHLSGADTVVGCVTNPSVGGCVQAATIVGGALLTGGEDELEIAAAREGEELAADEGASLGEDAASCAASAVPHSFVGATRVLEANGRTARIQNVRVGDKVMATDPLTGRTAAHTVQNVIRTTTDRQFTALTIAAPGAKPATLTTTWHHPFWDATTKTWTDASHLTPGTHLTQPNGKPAVVTRIHNYVSKAITYDLTIADLHSYYVLAGSTPVLVHNCDPLADYADSVRNEPGTKFASEYESPSGAKYYGRNRHGQQADGDLANALEEADHHGGCAEVSCLIQAQRAEGPDAIRGGTMRTVMSRNNSMPTSNTAGHGESATPCGRCTRLLDNLGIG